ncbi:hypothetical protein Q1695_009517 [Nippostrongylus brasiliensis]|nr:hypothetical protein Q1695_009517 [Nippostrongylus brasiliensis]
MFHAAKSGHENFSESTETIAALTPEEREKKAAELRERIKNARIQKEEQEKKEQIEKERRRREEGKKMLELKEKQREAEMRAIAEERKRAKQEEAAARQRVLEQIRLDKEARKAKAAGGEASAPSVPAPAPAPAAAPPQSNTQYNQAMIQVRLLNGQAVRQSFGASEPLSAVRLWLELNHSDGAPFTLLMPFPRKVMTDEDYEKPLKELGLVPSANFVMTR